MSLFFVTFTADCYYVPPNKCAITGRFESFLLLRDLLVLVTFLLIRSVPSAFLHAKI